jgi:hypothetical protein
MGATVIDGTGRAPIPDATILIRAGRIVAVGPAAQVVVPRRVSRIPAGGKFVIAGLWDAHVHLASLGRDGLATLVRYGITSVRDLGGDLDSVRTWRDAIENGQLRGPRIHLAGPVVEDATWLAKVSALPVPGLKELVQGRIPVGTEAEAVAAADSIATLGVEVLKVRNSPPSPPIAPCSRRPGARGSWSPATSPIPKSDSRGRWPRGSGASSTSSSWASWRPSRRPLATAWPARSRPRASGSRPR